MRKAGRLAAECLDMLAGEVQPGVPTEAIDRFVFDFAHGPRRDAGHADLSRLHASRPAPRSITWSATAFPSDKPLKEGDIVNIDVTFILDGWHGDSSRMYPVGDIQRARRAADRGHL